VQRGVCPHEPDGSRWRLALRSTSPQISIWCLTHTNALDWISPPATRDKPARIGGSEHTRQKALSFGMLRSKELVETPA